MKLINPILLTLNNTLHIKADNLEPVEVDSSCVDGILLSIDQLRNKYEPKEFTDDFNEFYRKFSE